MANWGPRAKQGSKSVLRTVRSVAGEGEQGPLASEEREDYTSVGDRLAARYGAARGAAIDGTTTVVVWQRRAGSRRD
jgi:hypothetical protein